MLTKFLETIRQSINRPLQYYEDICVRCGACIDACHFYAYSRDQAHIPAYRMRLVKQLKQSGISGNGTLLNWYRESQEVDDRTMDELHKAIEECTGCRRCVTFCPFDLDTALLVGSARFSLMQEGQLGMEMVPEIGGAEISKGEIVDLTKEFYLEQMQEMEIQLQKDFAPDLRIPVEKEGARVLYVPLVGEHAIIPAAKIFHAAGEDWTISLFTATNHSYFVGDMAKAKQAANWIVQEAQRLGVQAIVYPECGHATRTLLYYFDDWFKKEIAGIERMNIVQLTSSYLQEGKIRVQADIFDTPLTYHDPCNLGRNGGIYEEPRTLIQATATDFRELSPSRELNWCCGGGGGLVAEPEMETVRMKAGRKKAEQLQQSRAEWIITACENCKTQLEDLNEHYKLGVEIKGVIDLVADALIL